MFSSNPAKLFHLVFCFSICFSASCGFWSGAGNENSNADRTPFNAQEIPSEIPFSTREPEVFQCEIIVSSFINGEKFERKTFVARSGGRRLLVFAAGEAGEVSLLRIDDARSFSISREKKIYTESAAINRAAPAASGSGAGENFDDFLIAARLGAKAPAAFERLGAENGLSKFLVRLNNSEASEILIYVDENFKIPVRQEFYSRAAGGEKTLLYAVELKNFQLQTDDKFFEPPSKDFRRVSGEEFDKIVRQ
ncbi:MAG TPA: hypothetical protein VK400_12240 [Pyrinomonadaceae bacterium]|nr:hypothetical protein [Pyrinomonadaceae bacterium]